MGSIAVPVSKKDRHLPTGGAAFNWDEIWVPDVA